MSESSIHAAGKPKPSQEAFACGRWAGMCGVSQARNPYPRWLHQWHCWLEGWRIGVCEKPLRW